MSAGQKLDASAFEDLRNGQMVAEVRQLFGTPKHTDTASSGESLDVFSVIFPKPTPGTSMRGNIRVLEVRSLHVLYDAQGRVEKSVHYVGEAKTLSVPGADWRGGRSLGPGKEGSIKRGLTSRPALDAMFGTCAVQCLTVFGGHVWFSGYIWVWS